MDRDQIAFIDHQFLAKARHYLVQVFLGHFDSGERLFEGFPLSLELLSKPVDVDAFRSLDLVPLTSPWIKVRSNIIYTPP